MRVALTVLLVLGLPSVATAQAVVPFSNDVIPSPSIGLPLPHIGLPLPEIGLPLPRMGLSPSITSPPSRTFPERQGTPLRSGTTIVFFGPLFGWGDPRIAGYSSQPSLPTPVQRKPAFGRVRLSLQPGVVPQIYVDGYYAGTLDDVSGELTLDAGRHKLELRAEGYETLQIDVQISPDRVITYRGAMKALEAAPVPVPQAAAPADVNPPVRATIYVIPGCYIGNVPPKDAGLPPGCDEGGVIVFPPRP